MKKWFVLSLAALTTLVWLGCAGEKGGAVSELEQKIAKFADVEITYDHSLINENQKKVLENLYRASKVMDEIFLQQVYSKNTELLAELEKSTAPEDQLRLKLFRIMFGPFDRLDHDKPFYGNSPKPKGANFYPEDMTKEEFLSWIKEHPEDEAAFTSEFTVIRRQNGRLVAIPYSEYFKEPLTRAANYLREAAKYAENPTVKDYLLKRADAFLSNDYYESDMAWMDMKDHIIEVVIGPYEVYEDGLFNYKASFESFVTLRDPAESQKLARFAKYLVDLERNLPIPEEHKNFDRGAESPIVVAQEVFTAGDSKAGVQTLAFNLPNDERVRKAKGSKKVMLKNVNQAKFDKLLVPIAREVLEPSQLSYLNFDAFFNHVLMHEMSHGIGPGFIKVDGRDTEVKKELKETYSTIEEAKADVLGMYNNIFMIQKGEFPPEMEKQTWATFLAGIFRSIRFGINEAHGSGNAIIYNYLLEKGGYEYDENTQKVRVNFERIYDDVKSLATELLMIQATGDYNRAKAFIAKYAVMSPSMKTLVGKLEHLPVDIRPVFQIEKELN
ncbi:MAG: hypothetical protein Kow0037_05780 [Calditrichia bacterium]